jgi:hypothetical protein
MLLGVTSAGRQLPQGVIAAKAMKILTTSLVYQLLPL